MGVLTLSLEDAKKDAENRLQIAQDIINGVAQESYEADIVEEVIDEIDKDNLITRNRYGALVLNAKNLMFIDIDDYQGSQPFSFSNLFGKKRKNKKELILSKIEKTAANLAYNNLGFRVYETFKGYRVIVSGKNFDPRSAESKNMMNAFCADNLYQYLCIKQNCYRARLTPKPYRMKFKAHKIIFPERTETQQAEYQQWVEQYNKESNNYSSCWFIANYGVNTAGRVIQYHDKVTQATQHKKLA